MKLKKIKPARLIRWAVLATSTVFFLFISGVVSEHAICPIGGFEMFFTGVFNTGFTIAGLFSGMVILFLIMSVFSIIFIRAYCGYVCPMGALQELFEKIGRLVLPKKSRKKLRIPEKADKVLRWFKYPVLAAFVVFAGLIGGHWMIKADPFIATMGIFKGQGFSAAFLRNPGSYIFFFAILIFAFFMGRASVNISVPQVHGMLYYQS